ncbi:MAG: O-linked N-acetylglucosamine transferase, SPINDLY family protein [Spirulina sp. DLM2.Bin59]|nr:MAG: O-linked N-acetylglucosamine transferase, SPINDLY family protein [Spirulina sp. DLM2.Bin59]
MTANHLQSQAQAHDAQGQYQLAIPLWEQLIQVEPEQQDYYWSLGLSLLLNGQAAEAQSTWLMAMLGSDETAAEACQWELLTFLETAAQNQETSGHTDQALQIRQQIQELAPDLALNAIHFLRLRLQTETYQPEDLTPVLESFTNLSPPIDLHLLKFIFAALFQQDACNPHTWTLLNLSLPWIKASGEGDAFTPLILRHVVDLAYVKRQPELAAKFCELGLLIDPNHRGLTSYLPCFYQDSDQYAKGIDAAYRYLHAVTKLADQIDAHKTLMKSLIVTGGHWQESCQVFQDHQQLLTKIIAESPLDLTLLQVSNLFNSYFFAPYFADRPVQNRHMQNQIAQLCYKNTQVNTQKRLNRYQKGHRERLKNRNNAQKLRIGYLSFCLRQHSVGWLARSLFQHHDHDRHEIYLYLITKPDNHEPLQDWYIGQVDKAVKSLDTNALAEAIFDDQIDILMELDSITIDTACSTVMLKPAPIQVTWLGWDASGIPTIDYFIADDYVLPANAQDYYHEKILRLPQSYIACDGFEVGLPTLRREDLGVPAEAIAYYSVQKGYKRHPDTMRLQLEIIKGVPGSYFLIKGSNDTEDMERAFLMLADEVGVERDRLKFLAVDYSEPTHRANMLIADVVLDTYPYNGATTTMETLWMGIPLVTWVGEQFAARNSYTMLINAGVTEGIAHNAREYVEWGIRYGTDPELRHGVNRKLQAARRTAPLWNGRQFARNMEAAYEQMWGDYVAGSEKWEVGSEAEC